MRVTLGLATVVVIASTTLAAAQSDVIMTRKSMMQVNQNAAEVVSNMSEEFAVFDAAVAQAALNAISHDNELFPALFPDGSDVAPSKALPSVWEKKDEFAALSMKMAADAKAAADAATSLEGLQGPLLKEVFRNCTTCHSQFRAQQ